MATCNCCSRATQSMAFKGLHCVARPPFALCCAFVSSQQPKCQMPPSRWRDPCCTSLTGLPRRRGAARSASLSPTRCSGAVLYVCLAHAVVRFGALPLQAASWHSCKHTLLHGRCGCVTVLCPAGWGTFRSGWRPPSCSWRTRKPHTTSSLGCTVHQVSRNIGRVKCPHMRNCAACSRADTIQHPSRALIPLCLTACGHMSFVIYERLPLCRLRATAGQGRHRAGRCSGQSDSGGGGRGGGSPGALAGTTAASGLGSAATR